MSFPFCYMLNVSFSLLPYCLNLVSDHGDRAWHKNEPAADPDYHVDSRQSRSEPII
jgi:hypothetical protein